MSSRWTHRHRFAAGFVAFAFAAHFDAGAQGAPAPAPALKLSPAEHSPDAVSERILGAAWAGPRAVAVGDHGTVLLSDDQGHSYRQAQSVPADVTLTSVTFVDSKRGWAVGHWGVILGTEDGGEHWALQRSDPAVDRPLFSVHFQGGCEGWAVGLWSLMLHTVDCGKSWSTLSLPPVPGTQKADKSLFAIFGGRDGAALYVAAEQGWVLRSLDAGQTWRYSRVGKPASLWTGLVLQEGTVLVGGLGGSIYRSGDQGATWEAAASASANSITALAEGPRDLVLAAGLAGTLLRSADGGHRFDAAVAGQATLTAVLVNPGSQALWFSTEGPVRR